MKRSSVRTFIKDGVNAISPVTEFHEGIVSDFAAQRSNQYPSSLLVLESVDVDISLSAPLDSWHVLLVLFQIDKMDSAPEVYEGLVDACDEVAQKLQYQYRNVIEGYKLITMANVSRTKFVKSPKYGADCLTGIELAFDINSPDQSDFVC